MLLHVIVDDLLAGASRAGHHHPGPWARVVLVRLNISFGKGLVSPPLMYQLSLLNDKFVEMNWVMAHVETSHGLMRDFPNRV